LETTVIDSMRKALVQVWGAPGLEVPFTVLGGLQGVKASLSYDRNMALASGDVLQRHASAHVLNVSDALLALPADVIYKFLLHEAIHVGYPEHDNDFAALARKVGTGRTEREILGRGVLVERELSDGSFELVTTCSTFEQAQDFAKARLAGPGRYRLTY
jgi:hypothetical protein